MKKLYSPTLLSLFIICHAVGLSIGLGSYHWQFKQKLHQHRQERAKASLKKTSLLKTLFNVPSHEDLGAYPDQYLEQPLDHFDFAVQGTYKQRFWSNADHWEKPNGPVFLFIGGEGGLSSLEVQAGEHVTLAKKYGALVFAVEHRYYGQSINDDGLQLENIQHLSSQQALADLASFHRYASERFGLTKQNVWICFGGSYPGALSAWFRIKYPHLVHGAIASSAPVEAQLNFEGYNEVVARSLSEPLVNGSTKCVLNIKEAFKAVDLLVTEGQYAKLSKDFKSCEVVKDASDAYQLASNLADVFMSTVQYNGEMPGLNITGLCEAMTQDREPYQNLAELNRMFLKRTDQNCSDNSWENMVKQVSNTTVDHEGGVGIRQWLYQTCTQFGYYQTCDTNTTCVFSKFMSLGPNLDICEEVFEVDAKSVQKRIDFNNDYYGSNNPKGTRIVFVNGSIDPWHALSVLRDLSPTQRAIFIAGTAHCANMGSNRPADPPALRRARQEIDDQIGQWLEDERDTKLYFAPQ